MGKKDRKQEVLEFFCKSTECHGRDENGFCLEFVGCDRKTECDDYVKLSFLLDALVADAVDDVCSLVDKACNALNDSICVSGNDANTNMHWVRKLRSEVSAEQKKQQDKQKKEGV